MRLFVAIAIPEQERERLASLEQGVPGARWVPAENLHLTLRFIGEVDGRQAHDIDDALSNIRAPAFPMSLAGVGHFGNGGKPRALWVGVEAGEPLARLHAKVEQALQRAGLPPEGRKFKPHVSLARFNGNPGRRLYDYISNHSLYRGTPFVADAFVLYSSVLGQGGSSYRAEATYPLVHDTAVALSP
jgi:2'-5' RNA ligase